MCIYLDGWWHCKRQRYGCVGYRQTSGESVQWFFYSADVRKEGKGMKKKRKPQDIVPLA